MQALICTELIAKYFKQLLLTTLFISMPLFLANRAYAATNYVSPPTQGPLTLGSVDYFGPHDSLHVTSGTMTANSGGYTVTSSLAFDFISVNSGATLSYSGASGTPIYISDFDFSGSPSITINWVVSAPAGSNAVLTTTNLRGFSLPIYIVGASAGQGRVNGGITVDFYYNNIYIDGAFAQVNGNIVNNGGGDFGILHLGENSAVNYVSNGNFTTWEEFTIYNGNFTLSPGNLVNGETTLFTVNTGVVATIYGDISLISNQYDTATYTNSGTTFLKAGSSISSTNFVNNGKLNLASTFTTDNYSVDNTNGEIYIVSGGAIAGDLSAGLSLTVGKDSTNTAHAATTFTTAGNISGIPSIDLYGASFTLDSSHTISGVTTKFYVHSGNTTTLNSTVSGVGCDTTVDGNLIATAANAVATTGPSNPFVVSASGNVYVAHTFTPSTYSTFSNSGSFYVYGPNGSISGAFSPNASAGSLNFGKDINNTLYNNTYTMSGAITNTPTIRVYRGTLATSGANSISGVTTFTVDAGAAATLGASFSASGAYTNNGTTSIASTFSSGGVTNGAAGIFTFATGANSSSNITNPLNGIIRVTGNSTNTGAINNSGEVDISAQLAGAGTIANSSSGLVKLTTGANIANAITNALGGSIAVTGNSTNTGAIANSGEMEVSAQLSGAGSIAIANGGLLKLTTGANIANSITNALGGSIAVNSPASVASVVNSGDMAVSAALTATADITNHNTLDISANISMPGRNLVSDGTTTISGARTLSAATFNNTGTQVFSITDATTFDQLTCTGCAVTSGDITLNSTFAGSPGVVYTWNILLGNTVSAPPPISFPATSSIFTTWEQSIVAITTPFVGQALQLSLVRNSFTNLAYPGINKDIAPTLDDMLTNPTSEQNTLINALSASTTQPQFNEELAKLTPNLNSAAQAAKVQRTVFSKTETRVAMLMDDRNSNHTAAYTAGDLNPNTALWIGTFGNIGKQLSITNNPGYKSKSFGFITGIDYKTYSDNVIGLAVGLSNSNVQEASNDDYHTRIKGYHGLIYGGYKFKYGKFFDWSINGTSNKNKGSRVASINGVNVSGYSNYNSFQSGVKINFGKHLDLGDAMRITPLASLQYSFSHQPAYIETGSIGALNVTPNKNNHIVTTGLGAKLSSPSDEWTWWLIGSKELKAMVEYDVISPNQTTVSNFVIGSSDFTIINKPHRLSLKVGASFSFEMLNHLFLQVNYDYELRHRFMDYVGMLKLKYLF